MLVCSTGVIGRLLPMPVIESRHRQGRAAIWPPRPALLERAAHAILTTDTRIKVVHACADTGRRRGAPDRLRQGRGDDRAEHGDDARLRADRCRRCAGDLPALARAADQTFNCVSVEGHTSTNDSLLLLANGCRPPLERRGLRRFGEAATAVCAELARAIAADAEGAKHLVTIACRGTAHRCRGRTRSPRRSRTARWSRRPFSAPIPTGAASFRPPAMRRRVRGNHLSLWLGDFLLYDGARRCRSMPPPSPAFIKHKRDLTMRLRLHARPGPLHLLHVRLDL